MIYLDNSASSFPKPACVIKSINDFISKNGANPGRSGHKMAMDAASEIFETRQIICKMFDFDKPENVVFVPNATYGLNLVLLGLFNKGDHIITTNLEHNSVLRPVYELENKGVEVSIVDVDLYDDEKTVKRIKDEIKENTKGIIVTQCSNVCSKIMPIEKISRLKNENILLIVDGSQGAGAVKTGIIKEKIDFYIAPSHKSLMSIQGTGFVIINSKKIPKPFVFGGTGSQSHIKTQPDFLPDRFESGTLPTPAIVGLKEGIKYILDNPEIFNHKKMLTNYAYDKLSEAGAILPVDVRKKGFSGVIPFNFKNFASDKFSNILGQNGFCTRGGLHCAPLFHQKMNTLERGMIRISFGAFNSTTDIDYLVDFLKKYK